MECPYFLYIINCLQLLWIVYKKCFDAQKFLNCLLYLAFSWLSILWVLGFRKNQSFFLSCLFFHSHIANIDGFLYQNHNNFINFRSATFDCALNMNLDKRSTKTVFSIFGRQLKTSVFVWRLKTWPNFTKFRNGYFIYTLVPQYRNCLRFAGNLLVDFWQKYLISCISSPKWGQLRTGNTFVLVFFARKLLESCFGRFLVGFQWVSSCSIISELDSI